MKENLYSALVKIILFLLIGAFIIYRLQSPLSNFIFYSFIFYRLLFSKNFVFWCAFSFVILINPWGFFYFNPYEWYIKITTTVGVSYTSMFGIIFATKTFFYFKKRNYTIKDHFKSFYTVIGFYLIFLILWSFIFGYNVVSIFNAIQFLPSFLLFLCIPRLLNSFELLKFNKLILLFSLIHFIGSAIEIINPGVFMSLIYFGAPPVGVDYEEGLIRFVGGITIHLYAMIVGLYYLINKEPVFKKWYLWLIVLLSYIFILNSATRGWMIASTFLIISFLFYNIIRMRVSVSAIVSLILIVLLLVIIAPPSFKQNITAAFMRLETLEALAAGDETADGTLNRLTERGPRVLSRFNDSPIVGFGYSRISSDYYDSHVGNHNLLLMGGVLGLLIFWLTILFIVFYLFRVDSRLPHKGYFVFGLAILTIMIIHSSSRTMISFYMPPDSAFLLGLFFNHFNSSMAIERVNSN